MGWKRGGVKRTFGGFVGYSGIYISVASCEQHNPVQWGDSMCATCCVIQGKRELTVRKLYVDLEEAAFPDCLVFARNAAVPRLEVEDAGLAFLRFGEEAERVVFAPLLPLVD